MSCEENNGRCRCTDSKTRDSAFMAQFAAGGAVLAVAGTPLAAVAVVAITAGFVTKKSPGFPFKNVLAALIAFEIVRRV